TAPNPAGAFLRTARPRQWIKNLLIFAAPAASGQLLASRVAFHAALAFLAFTAAATATYFINDAADIEADRWHPLKRFRPVAAGLIGRRTAVLAGAGAAVAAIALAVAVNGMFAACLIGYLALTGAYSAGLKNITVLEVLIVAGGFLLRTAGGAAATGVSVSSWFMLLTLFGSLFLVIAKRIGEQNHARARRRVLSDYSADWLGQTSTMALTGTVLAYAAWAFQYLGHDVALPLLAVSIVPFLAALMRYSLLVAGGDGERPEDLLVSDRFLLAAGLIWAATAGGALYLA
ncbi:MAG: decaprenyl-phosphate phosphoribosyltransferase, partial [Actinoplanes sp.]|nr:decaprenyl-phosphate phosphoribosyltransferase [Actinoplanes sp.]